MTKNPWLILCLVGLGLTSSGAVKAQEESGQAEMPFTEAIDVRVVNIEVVAEEKGERVSGLGAQDFVLEVDGKSVPIEYFTEVDDGLAVDPAANATITATTTTTASSLEAGAEVGISYLIFIDEYFSLPPDRDRVLNGLIRQLSQLKPQDRMAIVAYGGRKVDMLTTWSQDHGELRRVLEKAKEREAKGLLSRARTRIFNTNGDLGSSGPSRLRDNAGPNDSQYFGDAYRNVDLSGQEFGRRISQDVKRAIAAASSVLRSFASPPGRKVMMVYSGGWPADPAAWVTVDPFQSLRFNLKRGEQLVGSLADNANRLGYTLYMIDVPGIAGSGFVDAGQETAAASQASRDQGRERELQEESTLYELARLTGGKALVNTTNIDALGRVAADTRSYYWLGFTPKWQGDDKRHRVVVKVNRKGIDIRSRKGFSDLSRETEAQMSVESLLLFGDNSRGGALRVEVGRGEKVRSGKREVPIKVLIPLNALTFLPGKNDFVCELEVRIAVRDADDNQSDIPVVPMVLRAKEMPKPGSFKVWEDKLTMRTQRHDLVVSIFDKTTGKILSSRVEVPEL